MKLNDENIDELMFQLLEGDIQGEERSRLLDAIHADKHYSKLWEAWQRTVLNPNEELLVMNSDKLRKGVSKKGAVVLLWRKYAAAAAVILAVAFTVYYVNRGENHEMVNHNSPVNPKLQIIKVPAINPANRDNKLNDSVTSFKQKVQMMVNKSENSVQPEDLKIQDEINIPDRMELHLEQPQPDKIAEVKEPVINVPKMETKEKANVLSELKEESGVIMTVYSEGASKRAKPGINQVLEDKKNLLARIFSTPKLKIVNDSNTYTRKKLIIENKEYKIIAGF